MLRINYWAVVVVAVAALVLGAVWYSPFLFGKVYLELRGMNPDAMAVMRPVELLGEFPRYVVIAFVLARFVVLLRVADWNGALQLGLWVWVGFQAMLLMGAVLHEKMPWMLYVIHAGDALVKTLFMTAILGVWRRQKFHRPSANERCVGEVARRG